MKVKVDDFYTYELAGFGARWFAVFIDGILLALIGGFIGIWGGFWSGGTIALLVGAIYQWYFLTQNDGQTPGKQLVGIKVISASGGKISDVDALLRYAGYYLNNVIFGLGWLWALFDRDRQGWHDKMARTYVVRVRSDQVDTVYVDPSEKDKRKHDVI